MKTQPISIALFGTIALLATGCGGGNDSNLFKSVGLSSYQENGDLYVEVKSLLQTGSMQLLSIELPIIDSHDPSKVYGKLAVRQSFNGTAELALALNVSDTVNLPEFDGKLPNGTAIPVGGLDQVPVVGLPIGGSSAKVYIAYGAGVAMIGVAVPLREFDGMGQSVGNANIFPVFDFGKGVRGLGGIFTGMSPGQSGIALFVDAATAIAPQPAAKVLALAAGDFLVPVKSKLTFSSVSPSRKKKNKINYTLYKMNKKRSRLSVR
ncbi:MAG: hypothetical protein A2X94_14745 [Bdellovibrionales bacterium GWB1_55_8]|nr:MAG: hypothetical protein A2X94_14745 [Bdellovibrionales bacterium GWB1_55_8]